MQRQTPPPYQPAQKGFRNLRSTIEMMLSGDRFETTVNLAAATQPVLVIHAFNPPRMGSPLEKNLVHDGFHVFRFCLGPAHFMGVEETARVMSNKLKEVARTNNMRRFAIIGHSLGGIIARTFISLRRGDRLCHTLITLGSPHQGHPDWHWGRMKWLARLTPTRRDLKPDSVLMKKLRLNPLPPNMHSISLASGGDKICPPQLCRFDIAEGAKHLINETVDEVNHFDLMNDHYVYHSVRKHLEDGFRREKAKLRDTDETLTLSEL